MSDRRFKCYTKDKRALIVAQRTCDNEVLDYVSNPRDSEDEGRRIYLRGTEIYNKGFQEELDQVLRYI